MVKDPESLSDDSSRTVSQDRVPYLLAGNYTASAAAPVILSEITDKAVTDKAFSFFVKEAEFTVFFYGIKPFGVFSHALTVISMSGVFCPLRVFLRVPFFRWKWTFFF